MTTTAPVRTRSINTFAVAALVFSIAQPVPQPNHPLNVALSVFAIVATVVLRLIALRRVNVAPRGVELAMLALAIAELRIAFAIL